MTYRVRPLSRARQDVDAILDWLLSERKTVQGAANWLDAYEKAAAALSNSPQRWGFAPENEYVEHEIRQFLFKTRYGGTYRGVFLPLMPTMCSFSAFAIPVNLHFDKTNSV